MITITGSIEEVSAAQALIEAGALAKAGDFVLLDRVFGQDNESGAEAMLTFSIETKAQREAAQRAFVLDLPGRYEGAIDRWKVGQLYGWTTQHNGLGQAEGGKDLMIPREHVHGIGYGSQPLVGSKITYRRVRGEKGLRAELVVMIDNPKSVAAFIEWLKKNKEAHDAKQLEGRRTPPPLPSEVKKSETYQRATKTESAFKGKVAFRPDGANLDK